MLDIRIDDKSKNSYCGVIFNEDNELIWGYLLILVNSRISLMIHTCSVISYSIFVPFKNSKVHSYYS